MSTFGAFDLSESWDEEIDRNDPPYVEPVPIEHIPAGDFHSWVRLPSAPCPNCECCSDAVCKSAVVRDLLCSDVGSGGDFDLTRCPCPKISVAGAR